MNTPSVFFLIWSAICSVQAVGQLYEGDVCAKDGSKCENLTNCTILHDDVNKGKRPPLCSFNGKEVIVCCGADLLYKFSELNTSISYDACQLYKDEVCYINSKIPAPLPLSRELQPPPPSETFQANLAEQLPFMALIGYGVKTKIFWRCGGVLISRQYVLAAAHCSKHPTLGSASWVGFKNDNFSNTSNVYKISVKFNHPEYKPPAQYNDVALYRLDRMVQFTKLVKPICLPQVFSEFYVDIFGAGWLVKNKKHESVSNVVKIIPSGSCAFAGTAKQIPDGTDGENVLCVNGYDGGEPTGCTNTFIGGPLFTTDPGECDSGILLGILSIGKLCNGKDVTGIYSNITHFRPWIEAVVWPENSTYVEIIWN